MPYYLPEIQPLNGTDALIDDDFICGSFHILDNDTPEAKNSIPDTVLKPGLIIFCLDTGITYVVESIESFLDVNYDPMSVVHCKEMTLSPSTTNMASNSSRIKLPIKFLDIPAGKSVTKAIGVSKTSILINLSVSAKCMVELSETNDFQISDYSSFNNKFTFNSATDNFIDLSKGTQDFIFPDGTRLNTRYQKIFVNKDLNKGIKLYLNVTNNSTVTKSINTNLTFISVQV